MILGSPCLPPLALEYRCAGQQTLYVPAETSYMAHFQGASMLQ